MPKWNIKIIDAHACSARVLRQWCKNNETFRGHYFCTMQVQLPMLTKNCQANPIYVHRVELLCDSSLLLFSSEYLFESLPNLFSSEQTQKGPRLLVFPHQWTRNFAHEGYDGDDDGQPGFGIYLLLYRPLQSTSVVLKAKSNNFFVKVRSLEWRAFQLLLLLRCCRQIM